MVQHTLEIKIFKVCLTILGYYALKGQIQMILNWQLILNYLF